MVESTGVYLALLDINKDPIDSTSSHGYRWRSWLVLLVDFSIPSLYRFFTKRRFAKLSGIRTRLPIYYAAGISHLLWSLPKFGALAQIIPSPVLGGFMPRHVRFVSYKWDQILSRVDFEHNEHNFLIADAPPTSRIKRSNSSSLTDWITNVLPFKWYRYCKYSSYYLERYFLNRKINKWEGINILLILFFRASVLFL